MRSRAMLHGHSLPILAVPPSPHHPSRVSSRRFTSPRGKKPTGLARRYPLDRLSAGNALVATPMGVSSASARVLITATSPESAATTMAALARVGYRVATVAGTDEALQLMTRDRVDLLIVSDDVRRGSISRQLRRVREQGGTAHLGTDPNVVGILVLMERSAPEVERRRRVALAEGADDVLVEPFATAELLLRVATLLRRIARAPANLRDALTLANLHIDLAAHRVLVGERPVDLTPAEFMMLRTLAERHGRLCTRASLATGCARPATRGVDMRISRLRRKLGGAGLVIECVRGEGYRLSPARAAAS